jgi:hypothetical protein
VATNTTKVSSKPPIKSIRLKERVLPPLLPRSVVGGVDGKFGVTEEAAGRVVGVVVTEVMDDVGFISIN